jgi:assimilatory nitrate reductase catalytic subunit
MAGPTPGSTGASQVRGTGAEGAARTHCPYCALQCGMLVGGGAKGVSVRPRTDVPANAGGALCHKGWTAGELLVAADRLTSPLMRARRGAALAPAGWDAALDRVAAEFLRIRRCYGPDAVAVFGGGGLTNEKAYQLGKFARIALRTANIDYNGRFCMSSAAAAANRAFGMDRGLPVPITDVAEADAILLVGGNVAETMPPFVRHLAAQRRAGGRLIVVDPRETPTARLADLHLQITPGTDLALANGLLHLAIGEGLIDGAYLARRTTGFEAVRTAVNAYWPERVERITGVPVALMREAVRILAGVPGPGRARGHAHRREPHGRAPRRAHRSLILTARGGEQHAQGTDTVTAFINLALALGLPGRPGSGYGCLTGQGNGQGGREHGQKADQLPGYRRIDDPGARAHVAGVWGVDPGRLPGPGPSAQELLASLGAPGGPKALLVCGSNPVVSAPRAAAVEERLNALELLVVCDFVLSETAARADVVLPTTQWAEETGTITNLEGRVLLRSAARAAPRGVRGDLEVLSGLADRLAAPGKWSVDPAEVFDELRRASAGGIADYSGITYERIAAEGGVFWPCPAERGAGTDAATPGPDSRHPDSRHPDSRHPEAAHLEAAHLEAAHPEAAHPGKGRPGAGRPGAGRPGEGRPGPGHPGTPRVFLDRFATADGRARCVPVEHRGPAEDIDDEYPIYLTTGRVLAHYQSGAQTRRVPELVAACPEAYVEIHHDLAERLGLADGSMVCVRTRRGRALARVRASRAIRYDTAFMPFHWPGAARANLLTNPALDPVSRMPEFKVCAARIDPAPAKDGRPA